MCTQWMCTRAREQFRIDWSGSWVWELIIKIINEYFHRQTIALGGTNSLKSERLRIWVDRSTHAADYQVRGVIMQLYLCLHITERLRDEVRIWGQREERVELWSNGYSYGVHSYSSLRMRARDVFSLRSVWRPDEMALDATIACGVTVYCVEELPLCRRRPNSRKSSFLKLGILQFRSRRCEAILRPVLLWDL